MQIMKDLLPYFSPFDAVFSYFSPIDATKKIYGAQALYKEMVNDIDPFITNIEHVYASLKNICSNPNENNIISTHNGFFQCAVKYDDSISKSRTQTFFFTGHSNKIQAILPMIMRHIKHGSFEVTSLDYNLRE